MIRSRHNRFKPFLACYVIALVAAVTFVSVEGNMQLPLFVPLCLWVSYLWFWVAIAILIVLSGIRYCYHNNTANYTSNIVLKCFCGGYLILEPVDGNISKQVMRYEVNNPIVLLV